MKSLSLTRPLIIIVMGIPGSGKSFFARQFADTFSTPLVDYDYIRAYATAGPVYTPEEDRMVAAIAYNQIRELLKTQKTMIIDGGHNVQTDRQALVQMGRTSGYSSLTVWVQTDEPTSKQRATKRNPQQRQGDIYNTSLSIAQFNELLHRLTPPTPKEPYIVISGKHTYATQAKVVLKRLVQPRQELAQKPNAYSAQKYDEPQPPSVPKRKDIIVS